MVRIKQSRIRLREHRGNGRYEGDGAVVPTPSLNQPLPTYVPPSKAQAGNEGTLPVVPEVAHEPLQSSLPVGVLAPPALVHKLEEPPLAVAVAPSTPPPAPAPSPPSSPTSFSSSPLPSPSTLSFPPLLTYPSSSRAPLVETREAEATTSSSPKRALSNGNSHNPGRPRAVAAVVMPVLAPFPPAVTQVPLPSTDRAPPVVARPPRRAVIPFQLLSGSVFACERPRTEVPTYAQAVTPDQLAAYDAKAEKEYQNLLVDIRDYISAAKSQRALEGSMEWITSDEEWFLLEAEETAMDLRR